MGEAKAAEVGQASLFSMLGDDNPMTENFQLYGSDEEYTDKEIQEFEKDILGFYLTSNPLDCIRKKIPFVASHNISELSELHGEKEVTLCGMVTSMRLIPTKKDPTKFLKAGVFEDLSGKIEYVAFNKTLEKCGSLIATDKKLIMTGKYQPREESSGQIVIDNVRAIDNTNLVTLKVSKDMSFEDVMSLKHVISEFKGDDPLFFVVKTPNDKTPIKILSGIQAWVKAKNDFVQTIEKMYKDNISVEIESVEE